MSEIHRFSLAYDHDEDRLAWDTEDQERATTRLWLTQRLIRALLQAIFPMVQTSVAADVPVQHQSIVQSWEQAAAMADFGNVPAVTPQATATIGLVRQVQITPIGETLRLSFEFGEGETRTLGVGRAELRQTLSVIHQLHIAAGWPLDLWPDWISAPTAIVADEKPARH